MNRSNNLSPLPFYPVKSWRDCDKWYAHEPYFLRVSPNLLPFFFETYDDTDSITSVKFFRACCSEEEIVGLGAYSVAFRGASVGGSSYFNVYGEGSGFGTAMLSYLSLQTINEKRYVVFTPPSNFSLGLTKGVYYIAITTEVDGDADTYYSDIFVVREAAELKNSCIKLKWYDAENLELSAGGAVPYGVTNGGLYYNQLHLETDIGMPEYALTEDGEERDGRFFPIKQISEKRYKFKAVLPEYVCDCLRTACMADVLLITDKDEMEEFDVEHFEMDVKWLEGGYFAEVDCTFETDTVVKKIGKSYGTITTR